MEYLKSMREGFLFGLGFFIVVLVVAGIFAFVEPSSSPSSNYYIDPNSPIFSGISGISPNAGMYNNRILLISPPYPFTEICFKGGSVYFDVHAGSESTAGGNCLPGDIGYIIERYERPSVKSWEEAKADCLLSGMRLAEPFEWKFACKNAVAASLFNMTDNYEWASNFAEPDFDGGWGVVVTVLGNGGCDVGNKDYVAYYSGYEGVIPYRCAR